MERDPAWAGGRFRLRRRPETAADRLPLWARMGLRSRWPAGVVLAITAVITAVIACALVAAAVFLPGEAR